jgi:hypothetical protein
MYQRVASTSALYADGKAGLWRDPDLQLALEWRLHNEPNEAWASRIGSDFNQAMYFLDQSRSASDIENAEKLRLAEQVRELDRARSIADEQKKRLHAQNVAARKQRLVIWITSLALMFTVTTSVFAWKQSRLALQQKQYAEEQSLIAQRQLSNIFTYGSLLAGARQNYQTLLGSLSDAEAIRAALWAQLAQTGVTDYNNTSSVEFNNSSNHPVLLMTMNPDGLQSSPQTVEPGQTVQVEGFVNQIWIARSLPEAHVIDTGTIAASTSHHTFR